MKMIALTAYLASQAHALNPPSPGGPFFSVTGDADTQAPVVSEARFQGPLVANKPGKFMFKAKDDVSGITDFQTACSAIVSESQKTTISVCGQVKAEGNDWYSMEITPGKFVEKGRYRIQQFTIEDKAGNATTWKSPKPIVVQMSNPAKPDLAPPQVRDVKLDSMMLAGSRNRITFRATDDLSGIADFQSVCSSLTDAVSKARISICGKVVQEVNPKDQYSIEFDLPKTLPAGTYRMTEFSLSDNAGHITKTQVALAVNIANSNGPKPDLTPPQILETRADTTACGPKGESYGKFFFRADENVAMSLFKSECDNFLSPTGKSKVPICGAVTSRGSGWYSIDFILKPWIEDGLFTLKTFTIADRAGNLTVYPRPTTFVVQKCAPPPATPTTPVH